MQDAFTRSQPRHPLVQFAVPVRLGQRHDGVGVQIRSRVGDAGDAVAAQPLAELGQRGVPPRDRVRPGVVAAQPAVGVIAQPDLGKPERVEDPQHPASVLDAHRDTGHELVEDRPVEWAGHRFVVADGSDPAVAPDRCGRQDRRQLRPVVHLSRADLDRTRRRSRGAQVHVVVVQSRYHRTARGVEHRLSRPWRQRLGDLFDPVGQPDVDGAPVHQGRALNQHVTELR